LPCDLKLYDLSVCLSVCVYISEITHIKHALEIELTLDRCMKAAEAQLKRVIPKDGEHNPYVFMYKKVRVK